MAKDLFKLLKEHSLRHTSGRETILAVFTNVDSALSHADVEEHLPENFDRVTIYRTLKSFVEKGILHKIADIDGISKYALCSHKCSSEKHHHDHIHFKCEKCGDTTCIDSVGIPSFSLPEGYRSHEVNLLVQGNCPKCN
jgi:Fur family transcriptional regulator, ferric uptake regulator